MPKSIPMSRRLPELDGLKFLAFVWIAVSHFADFAPMDWSGMLSASLVLRGANGKWAMAIFAVISGYVCAASGCKRTGTDFGLLVINRYFRYMIPLLVMCLLAWLSSWVASLFDLQHADLSAAGYNGFSYLAGYSFRQALRHALLLTDP